MTDFRSIIDAALDVAIERLSRRYVDQQVFIFGPEGTPFWAKDPVVAGELEWLKRGVAVIERFEERQARPFVVSPLGAPFTAMALDAEGELYAVVLTSTRGRSAERRAPSDRVEPLPWLRVSRRS